MSETRCTGLLGRIFGHKYRPRYTSTRREREPSGNAEIDAMLTLAFGASYATLSESTYHGDVCERCGHELRRGI